MSHNYKSRNHTRKLIAIPAENSSIQMMGDRWQKQLISPADISAYSHYTINQGRCLASDSPA